MSSHLQTCSHALIACLDGARQIAERFALRRLAVSCLHGCAGSDYSVAPHRAFVLGLGLVFTIAVTTAPAHAQPTPDTGVIGYGIDVGVLFPDAAFETTLALEGHGEYYVTPRLAVRGLIGLANPGVAQMTENRLRQVKLLASGVYSWTRNDWRPFVAGGVGAYFVRLIQDGQIDPPGETRGGLNLGGGTEYVLSDQQGIKAEVRWDIVSHPSALSDATGATLTIGYKRYF